MSARFVPPAARKAARESLAARRQRARRIITALHRDHGDAECALRHRNAWQLLVATILSAQCTDERVNAVTGPLFKKYRSVRAFAEASLDELEKDVRPTGFFRNKARSIREAAREVLTRHRGRVPSDMELLTALPGVGRKTAHVVRGTWFGLPAITVDTHVGRLSRRLGLTGQTDPVKVEKDLDELLPPEEQTFTGHALIWHGRRVCDARRPRCTECSMAGFCPSAHAFD